MNVDATIRARPDSGTINRAMMAFPIRFRLIPNKVSSPDPGILGISDTALTVPVLGQFQKLARTLYFFRNACKRTRGLLSAVRGSDGGHFRCLSGNQPAYNIEQSTIDQEQIIAISMSARLFPQTRRGFSVSAQLGSWNIGSISPVGSKPRLLYSAAALS